MSTKHYPALDGLRGLAVLIVLIFHVGGGSKSHWLLVHAMGETVKAGWTGVSLFFVLSGFLITGILWDTRGRTHWWSGFVLRRTLRIFPLYYLTLILVLVTAAFAGTFHVAITRVWSTALFLQNFPGVPKRNMLYPGSPLVLRQFWSLAVEEQFYLVWPVLLLMVKNLRSAMRLCMALFVLSALCRLGIWMVVQDPTPYYALLPVRGGEMALGGWLALSWRAGLWQRMQRWVPVATVTALAVFAAASWISGSALEDSRLQMIVGLPAITIFYAGLLMMSLGNGGIAGAMKMRWLRWLGSISYGLYIFQLLFWAWFERLARVASGSDAGIRFQALRAVIAVVGTLGAAMLSFHFFEQPILRLKRFVPVGAEPGHGR